MRYVVIEENDLNDFERAVNERISCGYRLHGEFSVVKQGARFWFYQALVLEEEGDWSKSGQI